jgi:hypothetical protein
MNRTNLRHEIQPTPIEVTKVLTAQAQIGEGPVWDVRSQRLLWVDILGRALNLFNPADGTNESHELDDIVTSASPRAGGGVLQLRLLRSPERQARERGGGGAGPARQSLQRRQNRSSGPTLGRHDG